ncbi:MAG TPA: AAA family ATPase, partial [Acidimicrobiales bacterium]|nr:AAA family ATPase [Acidimicrobiales bacterium]
MLRELRVRDLGVIDDLTVLLGPGMTALTGETGAGKTLIVEAISLLLGGRADPLLVRPGAVEAVVEGRFDGLAPDADDVVLARVVPASGRSRAYVDGRMAPLAALAEAGGALVDLHGQHAAQALFSPAAQRAALDRAGGVDLAPLAAARRRVADLDHAIAEVGGDERSRAREVDLLRFQVGEIDAAGIDDADEDDGLAAEESRLSGAEEHRAAAGAAHDALSGDEGVL